MNLHGSYPASTSSYGDRKSLIELVEGGQPLGAEPMDLLIAEARVLLDATRDRVSVDSKRVVAFARACVELTPAGRLALAVVAPRRALELAALVSTIGEEAAAMGKRMGRRLANEQRSVALQRRALSEDRSMDYEARNDPEPDVEKAWAEEVSLRAERALRGETKGVPWETVRDEVRAMVDLRSRAL